MQLQLQPSDFAKAKLFIYTDIEREIRLAYASKRHDFEAAIKPFKVPPGGANFLAAMGLLNYTEFAGKLKYNVTRKVRGISLQKTLIASSMS